MKKVILITTAVLGIALSFLGYRVYRRWQFYNGISDVVWNCLSLFEDSTTYARGYSASAFLKLAVGDTKERVLSLLGEPIDGQTIDAYGIIDANGTNELWCYTAPAANENYWIRKVVFDQRGVVVTIAREYFVD